MPALELPNLSSIGNRQQLQGNRQDTVKISQPTVKETSWRGMMCHTVLDSSVAKGQHNPQSPLRPCCVGLCCSHACYFWKGDVSPNFPRRNKVTDICPPHRPPLLPGLQVFYIFRWKKSIKGVGATEIFWQRKDMQFPCQGHGKERQMSPDHWVCWRTSQASSPEPSRNIGNQMDK